MHCHWYTDKKGLVHNCIYCRSCGAVHDTVGSFFIPLGIIKLLFKKVPSTVITTYEITEAKKLARINNPGFPTLRGIHPHILMAMEENGHLDEDEDIEVSESFLLECLEDNNFIIRREAVIALVKFKDELAVNALIKALKDSNWRVSSYAATVLGEIGDIKAIKPLSSSKNSLGWKDRLIKKEVTQALDKLILKQEVLNGQ